MQSDCPKPPPPNALVLDEPQSFKIAQAVYNAATGKTEKVSKAFAKSYIVDLNSLKQLHAKCSQACTQWDVIQSSSSITVRHVDENEEAFSSFDRFLIYDSSKTAPVESIVYEFNVLIRIKGFDKPQNYKTRVRILSRLALAKQMEDDSLPPFFPLFRQPTIHVEVEYVDNVIARNMLGMTESWVNEVEVFPKWDWARPFQKRSHWIPPIFQFGILVVVATTLINMTDQVLTSGSPANAVGKWIIFSGACLLAFVKVASAIGDFVEKAIDTVVEISAIKLNVGDSRLFDRFNSKNIFNTISAVVGLIAVLLQRIFSNLLTGWLVKTFTFLPK